MMETEMGYRGSKSSLIYYNSQPIIIDKGVKEQRVDGSWSNYLLSNSLLRCTLMGFERSYPVKIPSNQFRFYSTNGRPLNPNFVTGFTDAEGSFTISIFSDNKALKLE